MSLVPDKSPVYLDDLTVGDEFRSGDLSVDAGQIIAFASQFDPQPFHLDNVAAQASFFGGLAASGWHTAAMTMRLVVDSVPFADGIIGTSVELSWLKPVRPGETLHVISRVIEIRRSSSNPRRATVKVESLTFNQDDEMKQRLVASLLLFERGGAG